MTDHDARFIQCLLIMISALLLLVISALHKEQEWLSLIYTFSSLFTMAVAVRHMAMRR